MKTFSFIYLWVCIHILIIYRTLRSFNFLQDLNYVKIILSGFSSYERKLFLPKIINLFYYIFKYSYSSDFHIQIFNLSRTDVLDFCHGPVVKTPSANAGNMGLIPGLGRFCMLQGN